MRPLKSSRLSLCNISYLRLLAWIQKQKITCRQICLITQIQKHTTCGQTDGRKDNAENIRPSRGTNNMRTNLSSSTNSKANKTNVISGHPKYTMMPLHVPRVSGDHVPRVSSDQKKNWMITTIDRARKTKKLCKQAIYI